MKDADTMKTMLDRLMKVKLALLWALILIVAACSTITSVQKPELVTAAWAGDNGKLLSLLAIPGTDVNQKASNGSTALYVAAQRGYTETVQLLLTHGADPNYQMTAHDCCPGWTPLMIASAEGHPTTVQALLQARANPNAVNELGRSPLFFAARYGYDSIVTDLIQAGADVNIREKQVGVTALMIAVRAGHLGTVRLLLKAGADTTVTDYQGNTALDRAKSAGLAEIVALLDQARVKN